MSKSTEDRIPDEDDTAEAPLTMAASMILTNLPKDASKALESVGSAIPQKGTELDYSYALGVEQLCPFHKHSCNFLSIHGACYRLPLPCLHCST